MSLVYFILWVIFNGRITSEIVIAGIIISVLLDLAVKKFLRINFTNAKIFKFIKLLPDVVFYFIVLIVEIIKANISVTRIVLSSAIQVEPCLVRFTTPLKTTAARIALANSITLTPGTVTVSLEGNELLVHALDKDTAGGLEGSIFEKLLSRMERIANA